MSSVPGPLASKSPGVSSTSFEIEHSRTRNDLASNKDSINYCVCVCVCVRVGSGKLSHFSCNNAVCRSRGQGIWTYAHLSFDAQKLRPEERRQHLDPGFTKGSEMKRQSLGGEGIPVMTRRVAHSFALIWGITASQDQLCQDNKQELLGFIELWRILSCVSQNSFV